MTTALNITGTYRWPEQQCKHPPPLGYPRGHDFLDRAAKYILCFFRQKCCFHTPEIPGDFSNFFFFFPLPKVVGPSLAYCQPKPQYLIPGGCAWLCPGCAQLNPCLPCRGQLPFCTPPPPLLVAVDRDWACGLDIVKQLRGDTDTYVSVKIIGYRSVCVTPWLQSFICYTYNLPAGNKITFAINSGETKIRW